MVLNKNNQVFTQWVNDYSDALYGFTLQRITDKDIAKDLLQETFLSAWKNVDNYNAQASVKTWLTTILKNKIIDHYRKNNKRETEDIATSIDGKDVFFDTNDHWAKGFHPQDWNASKESNLETKEFYKILRSCKAKLKDLQSQVFTMKYIDDIGSEEICKVLRLTSSNYWVLISRAKVQLRACLEANWFLS